MTKDEALRLALDTLKEVRDEIFRLMRNGERLYAEDKVWSTIISIQETLETKDEPVAVKRMMEWVYVLKRRSDNGQHMNIQSGLTAGTCWEFAIELEEFIKHFSSQRTWVGLTQEEFEKLINDAGFTRSDLLMMGACIEQIVDLVEAKLKERNT